VLLFKLVNLRHVFVLLSLEVLLPLHVEFLQGFLANFNVVFELPLLNIAAKFILISNDFLFKKPHFPHQILVQLVLENLAALVGQQLHFFLDNGEQQNLFIFVEQAVATLVKNFYEHVGVLQAE